MYFGVSQFALHYGKIIPFLADELKESLSLFVLLLVVPTD